MPPKNPKKKVSASKVRGTRTASTAMVNLAIIPDAEEMWTDFVVAYNKLDVNSLPPKEGHAFRLRLLNWFAEEKIRIEKAMQPGLPAGEYDELALDGVRIQGSPLVVVPRDSIKAMAQSIQQ